ncbi:hypothetical protein AURDEDRAFT_116492 [Auricularia subglabra TFB-10046 SS5]|nr:hypothetical protein AURDEDRAFT_116492 [Auricularia subglabra TFB-10046 SS5]
MPPSTSFELHAEVDELDPTSPAAPSPVEMQDAASVATLRAFTSAVPVQNDAAAVQIQASSPAAETASELEYEASCSECDSDAQSVSVHTDTITDVSSESATPPSARAAIEESPASASGAPSSAVYDGDDEDVFNAPSDDDSFARLKSASIWFRSPDSQFSDATSEAPSSPCARLADRNAESTPRGAQASTWMFVTQTGPARGDGKASRRVDVSPIRISGVPVDPPRSPKTSQSRLPRPTTSSAGSKLFLERTPRTTVATAQRGKVTRSAFVDRPLKTDPGLAQTQSAFSPPPAKLTSPVSRGRSLILPSSPLGTAKASPLARSAVGNALRTRCRSVSRPRSDAEFSTPSSCASDWCTPTVSPTPKARGRSPHPKA